MGRQRLAIVLLTAVVVAMLPARGFDAAGAPFRATAVGSAATPQDASAVESSLSLDRPARRLIQQGLRNEGFDPGTPDGLFGPRTRAAIRSWQNARGEAATGYLDGAQAELLHGAGSPAAAADDDPATSSPFPQAGGAPQPSNVETAATTAPAAAAGDPATSSPVAPAGGAPQPSNAETAATAAPAAAEPPAAAGDPPGCEQWNTEAFFASATASLVADCLAAGADVAARDDDRVTPLHWAAWSSEEPRVIFALLAAGADLEARNAQDRTPLHNAAAANRNPAVVEVLLAAGADPEAPLGDGGSLLHLAARNNGNPAVIAALLSAGADLTARNADGLTASQLAARDNRNAAVAEALSAAEVSLRPESQPNRERRAPAAEATANGQLPPDILVDRHLLRVERLLADGNARAARRVMNEITALQEAHDLVLPDDFRFQHARVALEAGLAEEAIASVNRYLVTAGRAGEFYRDALELLDSAEEILRRAEVERRRVEAERRRLDAERRRIETRQREANELARRQVEAAAQPIPRDRMRSGGVGPEMVKIADGRFQYYAPRYHSRTNRDGSRSCCVEHLQWVEFDKPLAISKYEVTRGEFDRFIESSRYRTDAEAGRGWCDWRRGDSWRRPRVPGAMIGFGDRPRLEQTDAHPVVCVSHRDAVAYAAWLSQQTGHRYRLPSPAEWQYAARAGSSVAMLHVGRRDTGFRDSCGRANLHEDESDNCTDGVRYTAEVGQFAPNGVGVYDMIGNVAEIVSGCGDIDRDAGLALYVAEVSPENFDSCILIAQMGGAYYHNGTPETFTYYGTFQIENRARRETGGGDPHVGFRVVRELNN